MKRVFLAVLITAAAVILVQAGENGRRGVSITTNDDSMSDDCSQHLQVHQNDFKSLVRGEETRALPNQPLTIHAEHNGGIQLSTWDKPEFSIKLCKQVASDDDAQGRKVLDQTTLAIDGSTVSVKAPENQNDYSMGTLLLVRAPRDATLDMDVHNGGISVRRFTGTAKAEAQNGGISLKQSTGKLTVHAQNGGITIQDCGGDVDARVENGGLSLKLPERWDGKGLEAHTQNGGLVVDVPRNLASGLEVSGSEHVSIICKGDICDNGQRTWDNSHRIFHFGSGSTQIRATTVNGGIVIRDRSKDTI